MNTIKPANHVLTMMDLQTIKPGMDYYSATQILLGLGYTNNGFILNKKDKLKIVKFVNRHSEAYRYVTITHDWKESGSTGILKAGSVVLVDIQGINQVQSL